METIEAPAEKVIIDDPDPQCSSDTSIEKIGAPDVAVAADPASQSAETNEVFDDAVGTTDPAPQSSAIAEIPDAAIGNYPKEPIDSSIKMSCIIRDEAIAVQQRDLKYLDFLRVAVIKMATLVAAVYGFVKNWAGLFRPIIDHVEAIASPLCKRYSGVPLALIPFADQKIEILTGKLWHMLPCSVKKAGFKVKSELRVVRRIGLVAAAMNHAKKLYAEQTTVKAVWRWAIDHIPLLWRSVRLLLSIVIFLSAKYNRAVMFLAAAATWLPLVKVDRIAKFLDGKESIERIKIPPS
ncbi:REF/SRPP-like protein OsI_017815 [Curcuma longa]|uniref:REF/SRPP-like protein OsI_017815 n=1 Tax=Curcuma longa TaxID=136217 RepID=UPI003D9E6168